MDDLESLQKKVDDLTSIVEELNDFIENASLPLHWVNGSGIIIWANQVELDMLGYTKEEYVGRHISNFHANRNVIDDILHRLINRETLKNYPAQLVCKSGEIRHVLINSNVFWRENQFIHTRCFTRDVTEIRQLDEKKVEAIVALEKANAALREENKRLKEQVKMLRKSHHHRP